MPTRSKDDLLTIKQAPETASTDDGKLDSMNINRKGRPKSFDALRELAQQIAHEVAQSGGAPVVIDGHKVTVAEAILRSLGDQQEPATGQGVY